MDMNYNKIEYLELLQKKSKKLLKQGSEDSKKLLCYSTMTTGHLDWCIRDHYLELLENFLQGTIQTFTFCQTFEETANLTSDIREILESNFIILSPNETSLSFANLLEKVFDICSGYLQDADLRDELSEVDEVDEVELKNSIEKIYFQIQNILGYEF